MTCRFFVYLCVVLSAILFMPEATRAATGLFGSKEFESNTLEMFPKWTGVLHRMQSDKVVDQRQCDAHTPYCYLGEWYKFLHGLQHDSRMEQLRAVQQKMNESPYIIDSVNWGVPDYWETPRQFFMKDGDCEDYAIAKFMSLRRLGVPNRDMRVVILNDENLQALHAVLTVKLGSQIYVLDNQIDQVVTMESIHHYRPIYAINETHWWRFSF